MSEARIVVDGLWQSYRSGRRGRARNDRQWALQGIDFSVSAGELFAVIGGNGSGKTTLLQTVAGVLPPTRGRVETVGRVASLVDLSAGFDRDLTGYENLRIGGVLMGLSRAELRRRWDDIIEFSGLSDDVLNAPLRTYSSGMGIRLGFSVTVHCDPRVLLVDEVLAVGDASFKQRCLQRIRDLRSDGAAVMLVSHMLGLVGDEADRVMVLREGQSVHEGPPEAAIEHYLQMSGGRPDDQDLSRRAAFDSRRGRRRPGRGDAA